MRGRDWLASLGGGGPDPKPAEWLDVLVKADEQPHPARWLAERMGVSVKSAERYRAAVGSGKGGKGAMPTRGGPKAAAARLMREIDAERKRESDSQRRGEVADLIQAMRTITPGRVKVRPKSQRGARDSIRTIKELTNMSGGLALVADAWRDGNEDLAEDELSDSILARYDRDYHGDATDRQGLAVDLFIVDYIDGIDYT